ncbi:hypothetical protein L484_024005 [Morus notabilis]|uniref:Uncharacterized protein n=1 Tax=Morus notabilis TaxID=981085 RepID=W9RB60_9ROSA|nr:hypothetical protein L484_024005 [Morus notabilis]
MVRVSPLKKPPARLCFGWVVLLHGQGGSWRIWVLFCVVVHLPHVYDTTRKVAKVTVVEFVPLEVWEVSGLESCKGKRPLFFKHRSMTHPLSDPAKTMGTRFS